MSIVTGVVEACSNKFDKYSLLVNGKWYSSKYEVKAGKGDTVEFDDGGKTWIRKLRVVSGSGGGSTAPSVASAAVSRTVGFPVPIDTKDRSIVRQNALNVAVQLVKAQMEGDSWAFGSWEERESSTKKFAELVVDCARIFEDYSSGDGDAAEAAAMLDE